MVWVLAALVVFHLALRLAFASVDLGSITHAMHQEVVDRLRAKYGDLYSEANVILSATHTHTAPVTEEGRYPIPEEGVMQPREYVAFLTERLADLAAKAWEARKPGSVGWGLGHAVVAQNRRAVYADGRATMYGRTDDPKFRGLEGHEDDGVEVLFFWDRDRRLLATAVNVACPSQEVEGLSVVSADFWHEVRESLKAKHGDGLAVLGWTGAAGDQSPHLMYRKPAEERMRKLRDVTRLEELARRVVAAWEEAHQGAVMESLGRRKAELKDMANDGRGRVRIEYRVSARGLIGFQSEFMNATRGTGLQSHIFDGYAPLAGDIPDRHNGVLISSEAGNAVAYSLFSLQERGRMFVSHGEAVYEGMIIGIHSRDNDLVVNPIKTKKLTNIRAAGKDDALILTPPIELTLEYAVEFIADDELVEVTPKSIRIRKRLLQEHERKRASRVEEALLA